MSLRRDTDPLLRPIIAVAEIAPVYGLRIPNQEAAKLTRRIITLSLGLLLIQAIISLVQASLYGQYLSFVSMASILLVPACGYFGAKWRNKMLLSGFAACSCLTCVLTPVVLLLMIAFTTMLRSQFPTVCPPGQQIPTWPDGIEDPVINGLPATCESIAALLSSVGTTYAILIPLAIVSTTIAFMSCMWGWKLYNLPYFVTPRYAAYNHPPVATTTFLTADQVHIVGHCNNTSYGDDQYERKDDKFVPDIEARYA